MVRCYSLIIVKPGKDKEVTDEVRRIEKVVEAHTVTGVYDVVAVIEVKDLEELGKVLCDQIRLIDGIEKTRTLVCYY